MGKKKKKKKKKKNCFSSPTGLEPALVDYFIRWVEVRYY